MPPTILVVDDTDLIRRLLVKLLSDHGYRVIAAADGPTAIQAAEAAPELIALLISDVSMPGMDGLELARRLRQRQTGLPVLFISGLGESALMAIGLKANQDYFLKPFNTQALLQRVQQLLAAA